MGTENTFESTAVVKSLIKHMLARPRGIADSLEAALTPAFKFLDDFEFVNYS